VRSKRGEEKVNVNNPGVPNTEKKGVSAVNLRWHQPCHVPSDVSGVVLQRSRKRKEDEARITQERRVSLLQEGSLSNSICEKNGRGEERKPRPWFPEERKRPTSPHLHRRHSIHAEAPLKSGEKKRGNEEAKSNFPGKEK